MVFSKHYPLRILTSVALASLLPLCANAALEADSPVLESLNVAGQPAFGPCSLPRLSGNGRYLAFNCYSSDIVIGDDNDQPDVFLVDRLTRETHRASVDSEQQEFRFYPSAEGIASDNGRFIALESSAPLAAGIRGFNLEFGSPNVFLRDVLLGTTQLISRDATGNGVFSPSRLWDSSAIRSELLFSNSENLFGMPDANGSGNDLYVRNWQTGIVELITATPSGTQGDSYGAFGSFSPDGRYVLFQSRASDLTGDNPNHFEQLFLRDRQTRITRRLTRPATGTEFAESPNLVMDFPPRFSGDGKSIVFTANSDELSPDDHNGLVDAYKMDITTGHVDLISKAINGEQADGLSWNIDISANGRYVAFFTRASNLASSPGPTPAIYVKDLLSGQMINVTAPLGPLRPFFICRLDLSDDGRTLVFDWRHDDPAQPQLRDRTLVYSVTLRGIAPTPLTTVPTLSRSALISMLFGCLALALWYHRHQRNARRR